MERLDERAVERISGPSWDAIREHFERLHTELIAVSPTARGELTTIYVKYISDDTAGRPYAVVWIKKSTELVIGLSLPDDARTNLLSDAPRGCKYAGLTAYLVVRPSDELPAEIGDWVRRAYQEVMAKR